MKKHAKAIAPATADEADFSSVLGIITSHRSRALMSVNVENILTYWEIGAHLSPRIHSGSWSNAVVGRLADYIKRNQPELRGYGKSNLYNMARFYDVFSSGPFMEEVERHRDQLPRPEDFFQSPTGKSGDRVVQCKRLLIPKEVLQRTFEEYLALPAAPGTESTPAPVARSSRPTT